MKIVNISKYLAYSFLGVLALLVIILMLAFSPIGVSTIVGFANDQEGIAIENVSGSFYSEVTLGKVNFDTAQISIRGDQLTLDIGLNCLFEGAACIDQFSARKLEITLLENNEVAPPSEPLTDYIELPIAASLEKLSIETLSVYTKTIDADRQKVADISKINASVAMHKVLNVKLLSVSEINVFVATSEEVDVTKEVPATTSSDHWIEIIKAYKYQAIEMPEVFVPINAEIEQVSIGTFCLRQGAPLCTKQTRLTASVRQQKIKASFITKPEQLAAANIDVSANVDVANLFSHKIKISVLPNVTLTSNEAQSLIVNLNGDVTNTELIVSSGKPQNAFLTVSAAADIAQADLPLKLEVNASEFTPVLSQWLPEIEIPINAIGVKLDGTIESYKVNAKVNVKSEQASDISLIGLLSVTNKRIELSELSTSGDLGKLNARILAELTQFEGKDGFKVDSSIDFKQVQLKPLVPSIDSQLNGNISLAANMTPQQLWGSLQCSEIKGKLQGFDLALLCDVKIDKKGLVKVSSFALTQGKNNIKGKGQFELPSGLSTDDLVSASGESTIDDWVNNTKSALDLTVDIKDLSSLYPPAGGTVVGTAKVSGRVDKPAVNANFNIEQLVFNELKIDSAQLDIAVDINDDFKTSITLSANEVWQGSMLAELIKVTLNGDLASHNLVLNLQHPDYSLKHELSGEAVLAEQDWRWSGMWDKGEFALAFDSFILDKPTAIKANKNTASIKQHCWLSTKMSADVSRAGDQNKALCIENAQYSATLTEVSAKLAYNLKVPLVHFYPEIVQEGSNLPLSTEIDLVYAPDKGVYLDSYTLVTQANVTTPKYNIELVALVANASLRDQVVETTVYAGTKSTGALGLRSTLNLDPENRTHKGQLQIDNLLLAPLQRFLPSVEKLNGAVVGNVKFDGELTEPDINGELFINDVEIVIDSYPYPITNFNQQIIIANKKAEIEGELELGSGTADYSGTLTLFTNDQLFDFVGELNGAGMQLAFDKNELLASPALKIAVNPSSFSLKGEVTIPNAQISIDKLPESAKSASSDTIIIGEPAEPPILPFGLDIDVRVLLDPAKLKRVSINALDLQANLGGDLRVQVRQLKDPVTQEISPLETYVYGSIEVLKGSYEAYGQNLQIQNGSIYFNGAPSLPQFDITAIRNPLNTADGVVAGLRISGNPVLPKVTIFSQPTMIQARQLSYLLQGTDIDGGAGSSQQVMLVNALVSFGVGNSENGVNKLGKSLGFDSLNIQTAGQGDDTQVQLTGRLSDDIQISYGVGLFDQASEVILRYQLMPKLYLEAKSGATQAVDLFYEWTRGE